jgi:cell division GTPase FtsZ
VLLGISGGRDLKMTEINEAAKLVSQTVDPGARIIFGAYYDRTLKPNQIKITLIATGFSGTATNTLFGGTHSGGLYGSKPAFPEKTENESDDVLAKFARDLEKSTETKQEERKDPLDKKKDKDDIWDIPTFLRRKR